MPAPFPAYRTLTAVTLCLYFILFSLVSVSAQNTAEYERYSIIEGSVNFVSDAPLERIEASSNALRGLVGIADRTFAFTLDINTFQGFNSPLQRIHFNENYLETDAYPTATFVGKFIEDVNLAQNGVHEVRVKGKLRIHGVEKERIIKATVHIDNGILRIKSAFTVLLEDHNIRIPRIVYQKISEVVNVEVSAILSANRT